MLQKPCINLTGDDLKMIDNWILIDGWLQKKLPAFVQAFNPPTTLDEIRRAEEIMQCQLPEEIRNLYLTHNGQSANHAIIFPGRWLSIPDMLQVWYKLHANYDQGLYNDYLPLPKEFGLRIQPCFWHPLWIPVFYDGDRQVCCIDLNPISKRTSGQLILIELESGPQAIVAKNMVVYMMDTLDRLITLEHEYCPLLQRFIRST